MIENLFEISKDQLLGEAQKMLNSGYRLVTATCVDNGDETIDVIYHFDKDYKMNNYKLKVKRGEEVPSISGSYLCAILVENEMKELFGVNITGIAIDYGGHMLLSDDELNNPFARNQIVIEKRGEK